MTDWTTEYYRGTAMNSWEKELYIQNKEKEVDKDQVIAQLQEYIKNLQQEQIKEMQEHQEAMLLADKTIKEQQAEIERLKKQLKNILPCKINDTIYYIYYPTKTLNEYKITHLDIESFNTNKQSDCWLMSEYKDCWFLDKAEAQARLEELKGE